MVYELIRNRNQRITVICALLFVCIVLLSGCDPQYGKYPFQRCEQWYSAEPQISLSYFKCDDGTWEIDETLFYNGSAVEIDLAMHSSDFWVYPANSNYHNDRLFSGSWKYRNGNLVLVVKEDFIFDGKYSKIILKPIEENTTIAEN